MVFAPERSVSPSLKLGDYLSVQAHKPCSLTCTTFLWYPIFSKRYSVLCKVYTGYCGTSEIEHVLCACTIDNPLAKAPGLSLRTGAQTMRSHLKCKWNMEYVQTDMRNETLRYKYSRYRELTAFTCLMLVVFAEKPCSKPLELIVVYITIFTFSV